MAAWNPQANEIFLLAAEIDSPLERQRYLDGACGGDAELRGAVEALLRAGARAAKSAFLESGAFSGSAGTLSQPSGNVRSSDMTGSLIGNYKLLERIGEGGFGVVFMAEQAHPVQRRVAVKIIKPGMDSAQVIARFQAERQALALMDHPNIAKVLDAGTTEAGRPFFVMELVKGAPITKYCDEQHLSPQERLELFIPVCQAVQHAHQKGVIHRDIKPSNVIIALYDGKPVPKVIDFGVAKAIAQKLSDRTMFTEIGSIVGTLEYMSPEQAELNNLDIDTRADIYSLGVILYELLTGSPPFTAAQLRGEAFDQMLRMIREVEPQKPSTKLSTAAELPSIAANRKLEPKRLTRLVHGELDWVVMKCLEKDRARRYETANGLAMELRRYLSDEPVTAGAPSAVYRLRKFIRRNRPAVLAGTAIGLLLAGGVISTSLALIRERKARQQELAAAIAERTARETAEVREAETKAVLDFVENKVFAAARPAGQEGGLGRDVTLRKAVEAALPFVEKSFADRPLIEARLRLTLGRSFQLLGEARIAAQQFEAARALYTNHRGPDHTDTLVSMSELASSYADLGRFEAALKLREETLACQKSTLGPDHPSTLRSMTNLANSYDDLGRYVDALTLREETLALKKQRLGLDHPDTLSSMSNLAASLFQLGRSREALMVFEETFSLRKAKLGADHPETLKSMNNLAISYAALGRHTDACRLFERVLALRQAKLGPDHPQTLSGMHNLAMSYGELGRHAEAVALYEEVLTIVRAKLGPDHPDTLRSMNNLAYSYSNLGRHADALKLAEESLARRAAKLGPDHPETLVSMGSLSDIYDSLDRYTDALQLREQTLTLRKAKLGTDHPETLSAIDKLAVSYARLGRHADALQLREETLALRKANLGPDHPDTLWSMAKLAQSYIAVGRYTDALVTIDDGLARAPKAEVQGDLIPTLLKLRLDTFEKLRDAAGCLETAGNLEALKRTDAQSLYQSAGFRAVCAAVIRQADETRAGEAKAAEQADQAMAWLKQAVAAGYRDTARILKDRDLDPLRHRNDFQALLAGLPGPATTQTAP